MQGRLGNLARIDDMYDVAISTACGGLDNLISETIAVGQACIEHIRKNDLGRVQVMCLDKIARRDVSPIATPENAPRLFDLITVKEAKFAPCFFQLLTNTLVAKDLEQGKRLAFGTPGKRFRVVTLDGQVIDTSGTMSGGGGRPMKGRMSNKIAEDGVSPEHVARCEQEQTVAVEALRIFVEDRQKIDKDLAILRKRLPDIDMSISKIEMDLRTGSKRREEAERRLAELQCATQFIFACFCAFADDLSFLGPRASPRPATSSGSSSSRRRSPRSTRSSPSSRRSRTRSTVKSRSSRRRSSRSEASSSGASRPRSRTSRRASNTRPSVCSRPRSARASRRRTPSSTPSRSKRPRAASRSSRPSSSSSSPKSKSTPPRRPRSARPSSRPRRSWPRSARRSAT